MKTISLGLIFFITLMACHTSRQVAPVIYSVNEIDQIPDSVFKMKDITVLSIGPSWVMEAPLVGHVDQGGKKLTELPEEICELKQLTKLRIWSQRLKSLPVCVYQLKELQELDLSFNPEFDVSELISRAGEMKKLRKLNLYGVASAFKDSVRVRKAFPDIKVVITTAE